MPGIIYKILAYSLIAEKLIYESSHYIRDKNHGAVPGKSIINLPEKEGYEIAHNKRFFY